MASAIVWATSTGRPFLRRARSLGFSIDDCRQLMGPGPQPRQPRCARKSPPPMSAQSRRRCASCRRCAQPL